jgi:HAD superfamily hydrolase (TIGR01450 family)
MIVDANSESMTAIDGVVLDLDGTLVRGDRLVPGAREGWRRLQAGDVELLLFSNNPTRRPADHVDRLAGLGIEVSTDQVLTSAVVSADFLAGERPRDPIFVVGSPVLRATLRERGLAVTDDPDAATVVLGSFDREFHYDRLAESLWALEDADAFFGTDPDRTVPTDDRPIPGSGAIVAAMAGVAEREPDAMLGKPSRFARRTALERLGTDPTRTLVVGDRLDTDVALAGDDMASALVLTGVDGRDDVANTGPRPTYVLESLADVGDALDDATS